MTKTVEQRTRAYAVLDFIEAHPDKHDQDYWLMSFSRMPQGGFTTETALKRCGTTACYAGWTVLLAGLPIQYDPWGDTDKRWLVRNRAAVLLGLTDGEEQALFRHARDLADVRKTVSEIFGPRPQVES